MPTREAEKRVFKLAARLRELNIKKRVFMREIEDIDSRINQIRIELDQIVELNLPNVKG